MAGFGWQELVILSVLALIWLTPLWLMVRGTRRFYDVVSDGWVVASFFFSWLALLLWLVVRRPPRPQRHYY